MGDNQAFTIWEKTTVDLYDAGVLTPEVLACLMEPYRGSDIDSGGSMGLLSKDGLEVEDIVLKVFHAPDAPVRPAKSSPQSDWNSYYEARCDAFDKIAGRNGRFGWH